MAARIQKQFDIRPEMIEGKGGVFKVWLDDRLLWDKRAMGNEFPSEQQILDQFVET